MRAKSILIMVFAGMLAFSGCTVGGGLQSSPLAYGGFTDAGFRIPPVPIYKVDQKFHRQTVPYATDEAPGTIIVDTGAKFLYYVLGDGQALRYGIGVGKAGFEWHGTAHVERKREWPDWSAPSAMMVRERNRGHIIPAHMEGGLMNPLGARALYLYNEKGDTGYRLHGSPEWWSIGKAVSAGCIRLMNQDIIDLYDRAPIGTKVIVI
ncbi:L,D-transpeptidase [Mesorhizobium tamadayense]|uniref:L,D-transpeptidase n=1 Tax=Mesorhizobium tamadayense TaxID=425306 RepID=A0A3P3FEN1_9HYPH|nr:L,D-transpeptidase [Mesorhizobium tamadayense]RRH97144.1 L,D-transpeptidase [Mesorhizobium tamadayense]